MISRVAFLSMHTCPLLQPGMGDAGGMNVYAKELAEALVRRGVQVDVYTRRRESDSPDIVEAPGGFRVHHLDAGPPQNLPILDLAVHVVEFAERVIDELGVAGLPDIVHSHYWLSGWAGLMVKRKTGVSLAHSFHTLGRVKELTRRKDEPVESLLRIGAEHDVIAEADCLVASTPFEADDLILHYGADPMKLCVTPPGVNHQMFKPGPKAAARAILGWDESPRVLFVGRIQPLKGADVAVEAFARLRRSVPEARLAVVGGPSGTNGQAEYRAVREAAAPLGDSVEFLPPVPHPELVTYFQAADVLHVPSRSESFGMVVLEAQACGLPVVATNIGGLPHTFSPGESGLLVDGWDPDRHASALGTILFEGRDRYSESATEWASNFNWDVAAGRVLEIYLSEREKTS